MVNGYSIIIDCERGVGSILVIWSGLFCAVAFWNEDTGPMVAGGKEKASGVAVTVLDP